MKKVFSIMLMLSICISSILISGCNETSDFWTPTYQKIEEFKNNEKYSFLTSSQTLTYSSFIENSQLSSTLKEVYEPLSKNLMFEFNALCDVFSLKPILLNDKNYKKIEQSFEQLQKELEAIKQNADEFLSSKQVFEQTVYENAESSFAKQKLREFKKSFSKFLYSLENFNKTFNNAYQIGYQTLPQTKEAFEKNKAVVSLATSYAINSITNSFVDLTMRVFDGEFNGSNTTLLDLANDLKSLNLTTETSYEKYSNWKNFKTAFDIEQKRFLIALENINLDEYHKNKELYKDKNPNLIAYTNTIENFVEISCETFADYTKALI